MEEIRPQENSLVADKIANLSNRRRDKETAVNSELERWARDTNNFKNNLGNYVDDFARSSRALGEIQQQESATGSKVAHSKRVLEQKEQARQNAFTECEQLNQQLQSVRARDLRIQDAAESYAEAQREL